MKKQPRFSRGMIVAFWLAVVTIIIAALIYTEQIAILYVLATISLVALLITVAISDLENVGNKDLKS